MISQNERKHLQTIYLIRGLYLKWIKNTYNLITKLKLSKGYQWKCKLMKRCSVSLIIREMHIRTTHFTITMGAAVKNTMRSVDKDVEKVEPPICWWWECKITRPPQRTLEQFLRMWKLESPHSPEILLLTFQEEWKHMSI